MVLDPKESLSDLILERIRERTSAAELSRLGSSGFSEGSGRAGGVPGTVAGLAVDGTRGNLTITWNPVPFKPRPRYRVEISESQAFTDATVVNTYNTELMWTKDIDESTTYFARVRAEGGSNSSQLGPFSATLNVTTGEIVADGSITTAKMADDAVTTDKMADESVTVSDSAFTAGSITIVDTADVTLQTASLTADGTSSVFVALTFAISGLGASPDVTVRLKRDGTTIWGPEAFPNAKAIIAVTYSEVPTSGSHTYTYTGRGSAGAGSSATARSLFLFMNKR